MQLTGGNEKSFTPSLAGITLIRFYGYDLRFLHSAENTPGKR